MISDQAWERIRQLLPAQPPRLEGGRPPIGDREVLTGVLFVLKSGIPWEELPREMGCGCGMTCLRRLRHWQRSGAWLKMQDILRLHLRDWTRYDWSRARRGERSPLRMRGAYRHRLAAVSELQRPAPIDDCAQQPAATNLPGREAQTM
jgi:transposase